MLVKNWNVEAWDKTNLSSFNENDVVIWKIPSYSFSKLYSFYGWVLSDEEYAKANRYYRLIDYQNYMNGKIGVRILLGLYLKLNPSQLSFFKNDFLKPYLSNSLKLFFNISKAEDCVIVALSFSEVGVDIIKIKQLNDLFLLDDIFSNSELIYLNEDESLKAERFYYLWTRKESYVKQVGTGIISNLNDFSVLENTIPNKRGFLNLNSFLLNNEYCISICSPLNLDNIKIHELNSYF